MSRNGTVRKQTLFLTLLNSLQSQEGLNVWGFFDVTGKLLNIHPSLLPSFKGVNAQKQALQAGVRVAGCTVHFVAVSNPELIPEMYPKCNYFIHANRNAYIDTSTWSFHTDVDSLICVQEEVDAGAIIVQEAVPVMVGDTEESLCDRIREAEHRAFPAALELVASGAVRLGEDGHITWKS